MPIKRKVTKAGTVRYYVETRSAGRKVYHPGGYATRRDAEAALAKLTVAKGEGTYRAPTTTTTGDYLTAWVASHKKLRPRTRQEYERVLRTHVLPVIGDVRLDRLRPEHVQRVIDRACDRGLAVATVEKVQRTIHAALRLAVARGTLTTNPAERDKLQMPGASEPDRKLQPPTPDQVATILGAAEGHAMHLPLALAAWTGLRRGEVLGLRWRDVDLDAGELHVRQALSFVGRDLTFHAPKTRHGDRTVPMSAATVALLRQAKAEQATRRLAIGDGWRSGGLVVDNGDGSPMHPERMSLYFARLSARLGMGQVRLHDLRHAFCSALLGAGVPVLDVSRIAGHASAAFTMDRYGHLTPRHAEGIRAALDSAYAGGGDA